MAHYINNPDLLAEIVKCQTSNSKPNEVSDKLAMMLMQIVTKYSNKASFRNYSFRDDMVAEALLHLLKGGPKNPIPPVLRFDATYATRKAERTGEKKLTENPLSFITMIVHNSFLRTLKAEDRVRNLRDDLLIMHGHRQSFSRQVADQIKQRNATEGIATGRSTCSVDSVAYSANRNRRRVRGYRHDNPRDIQFLACVVEIKITE